MEMDSITVHVQNSDFSLGISIPNPSYNDRYFKCHPLPSNPQYLDGCYAPSGCQNDVSPTESLRNEPATRKNFQTSQNGMRFVLFFVFIFGDHNDKTQLL